jgi:hypothetical protein
MRSSQRLCLTLLLCMFCAGPALGLPRLSVHLPTLTAPAPPGTPSSGRLPDLLPLGFLGMAIPMKDVGAIAAKFKTRASAASQDYGTGVATAGAAWEAGAVAGEPNYEQGVQESIGRKAFGKGVRAAGASKYVENAKTLGTQRYPTGIANAEGAYMKGVGPYIDVVRSLNLPPRGPKGSAQNQQRAQVVAAAMRAKKVGS